MGRRDGNEGEFRAQSYFRLLKYARPYWFRLTVGIVFGILVGGSLFVSLMMIPRLVGVVDPTADKSSATYRIEAEHVTSVLDKPGLTREEKEQAIQEILHPTDDDPQLTKLLNEARSLAKSYHLPYRVEGHEIMVEWPVQVQFNVVGPNGGMAWQILAVYVLIFTLAWAVKNIATFISNYYTRWVGSKVVADLRDRVFEKLVNQSLQYYSKIDIGHLISRSTNDTAAIENAVSNSVADLTSAPIQIFACLVADRDFGRHGLAVSWPAPGGARELTVPPGPVLIAQRTGADLVPIAAWFVGNRTHLEIGEPIEHRPGVDGAGVMAQQMVDFFATQIAGHVTDWHMMQRFFPGEMA